MSLRRRFALIPGATLWGAVFLYGCEQGPPTESPRDPAPVLVEAVSPLAQRNLVGAIVNHFPAVRALDASGQPVADVAVEFVGPGGSSIGMVTTDASGVARLATWRVPSSPGSVRVEARVGGLAPVHFDTEVIDRGFDLQFRVLGIAADGAEVALAAAEAKIEGMVFADLPDETLEDVTACGVNGQPPTTFNEAVDDLLVLVRFRDIDGAGGAGATGNPCLIREDRGQTVVGIIELDLAEWSVLTPALKRDFILHELIHVMGFVPALLNRTLPSGYVRQCLDLPSTGPPNRVVQDSHFSCEFARSAFEHVGGRFYQGASVPLENGANQVLGSGTLNHHWRKSVFGAELMTGWFPPSGFDAKLSRVTLGMLEDLGYGVVMSAADEWSVDAAGPKNGP